MTKEGILAMVANNFGIPPCLIDTRASEKELNPCFNENVELVAWTENEEIIIKIKKKGESGKWKY